MSEELSPLSHDYVFNYVFKKLSDTLDKYRHSIPAIEQLENSLSLEMARLEEDPFQAPFLFVKIFLMEAKEKPRCISGVLRN